MKFLFLISSALEHFDEKNYSRFNTEQRFYQTLQTIQSIKEKAPDSYICLFECSHKSIPQEYKDILKTRVNLFLEFYNESGFQTLYENFSNKPELIRFGKSLLETRGILNCLYYIQKENLFTDVERIFKITGRYTLNQNFNIQDYCTRFLENKYVAKIYNYLSSEQEEDLENIYAYLYQAKGMMITGLWSFDKRLFLEIIEALEKSFNYIEKMIQYTTGTDIEHALYRYLNKKNLIDVSNLGLNVIKGMETADYSI